MARIKATAENIAKLKKCYSAAIVNEVNPGSPGEYLVTGIDDEVAKQFGSVVSTPTLKPLSQPTQEVPEPVQNLYNGLMSFKSMVDGDVQTKLDQGIAQIDALFQKYKKEMQQDFENQKQELAQKHLAFQRFVENSKADFQPLQNRIEQVERMLAEIKTHIANKDAQTEKENLASVTMIETCEKYLQEMLAKWKSAYEKYTDTVGIEQSNQADPSLPFVIEGKKK